MANQASNGKQQEDIQMNVLKKPLKKESFRTNFASLDESGEPNDAKNDVTTEQAPVNPQDCRFLAANPRNQINDSLNRSLDEEISKQLSKKPKNWLKLNVNGTCKMLKAIKKGIVKVDASILKFRDKLENIMASEVQLTQQFLVGVRFIDLADEHMLRMSKVNRNLKYSAWFVEMQQTKEKIIAINESPLPRVQYLSETLVKIERGFSRVKDDIEQKLQDKNELKLYSKLVSQSSARIASLKKHTAKELRLLNGRLKLKQFALLKVHKFCIAIIRLLDTLLPYFKKANCGCDLIVRTLLARKELAWLANYA